MIVKFAAHLDAQLLCKKMSKKTIILDGSHFSDLAGFYEAAKRLFTSGLDWEMGHSLDTLNDILYGGFGVFAPGEKVRIIWKNAEKSREDLGYAATAAWYQAKLLQPSVWNVPLFEQKLAELEAGGGQVLFDTILEIFASHENLELVLE